MIANAYSEIGINGAGPMNRNPAIVNPAPTRVMDFDWDSLSQIFPQIGAVSLKKLNKYMDVYRHAL